jgi:hypothetical protein
MWRRGEKVRFFLVILMAVFLTTVASNRVSAQLLSKIHEDLSASLTLDTNTNYIFRGITIVDDPVFQPDVSITFKNLTAGMWWNVCLSEATDQGGVGTAPAANEVDYYMDYTYEYKMVSASLGWFYYEFPHTGLPDTQELYLDLGLSVPLNPSVTMYWDVDDNAGGLYWLFSVSHDIDIASVTFTPSLGLGISNTKHSSYYAGVDMDSTHVMDMNFGLNVGVPLGAFMEKLGGTMNLHLNYSFFPGTGLRQQIQQQPKPINAKDVFYMGIGFTFNF